MKAKKFLAGFALGMSVALGAQAAYPDKTITVVVPFPAGGSTDAIARAIGRKITARFNQPWIIDNRPGATGFEIVANAPEQFEMFQRTESARWKSVIETGKITAD